MESDMPRFDLRVEFPGPNGDRIQYHTVGVAVDLESLPTAVAASLAQRIVQQDGVVPEGPSAPEDEKKYAELVTALERSQGPVDRATKNRMRKALGLPSLKREKVTEAEPVKAE